MPEGKPDSKSLPKTGRGTWFYLVISTVTPVSLACLAALGRAAFLAWKDGNWDGIAILAISAVAVAAIPVATIMVLHHLNNGGGERKEEGTQSA
jgi:hypothetical protein